MVIGAIEIDGAHVPMEMHQGEPKDSAPRPASFPQGRRPLGNGFWRLLTAPLRWSKVPEGISPHPGTSLDLLSESSQGITLRFAQCNKHLTPQSS